MFRIKKVLNVNVVLAEQNGDEYIAFGKGIGYHQKVGAHFRIKLATVSKFFGQ